MCKVVKWLCENYISTVENVFWGYKDVVPRGKRKQTNKDITQKDMLCGTLYLM